MKRLISAILVFALALSFCPVLSLEAKAETEGDYTYTLSENWEATITGYTGAGGDITIPTILGGCPVTAINDWVFEMSAVTSVTIGGYIEAIGSAFINCQTLKTVVIEDGVKTIGYSAFDMCTNLTAVTIPVSVTTISSFAFANCYSLKDIYYDGTEEQWESISIAPFNEELDRMKIHFYEPVITIVAEGTFGRNLTWKLDSAGTLTISGTGDIPSFDGYLTPWDGEEASYGGQIKKVVIEPGVTSIGWGAFYNCYNLTSVTIPESITRIAYEAFPYNGSVTDVYYDGTEEQWNFIDISYDDYYHPFPNATMHFAKETERTVTGIAVKTLPNKREYLSGEALDLTGLVVTVTYSDGTTEDITEGFRWSTSGGYPYGRRTVWLEYYSGSTTSYTVLYNKGGTFGDNLNWKLDEEGTLTLFGTGAMQDYEYEDDDFYGWYWGESVPWYNESESVQKIVVESGVTGIGANVFRSCTNVTSVTIPGSVASIGSSAFNNCKALTTVQIEDGVTTIDSYAFSGCTGLTTINIPDSVTTIGSNAFQNCTGLTEIEIPGSGTSIGNEAFYGCSGLTSLKIANGVTTIGFYAFWGCSGLTEVEIPDSVTTIRSYAFPLCSSLVSVTIGAGVTTIGRCPFYCCENLTEIRVAEDNVAYTSDDRGVLFDKAKTTLIQAPGGLSGEYAIPDGVTTVYENVFRCCKKLSTLVIPVSVTSIEYAAFDGCGSLTDVYYGGTEEQWNSIGGANDSLTAATIHFAESAGVIEDENANRYDTVSEALEEVADGGKLTLLDDVAENVSVAKNVTIDLNGKSITGTVTVAEGYHLFIMDSQTDDYTVEDANGYGMVPQIEGAFSAADGYLMITEEGGVSFHKVEMKITAMSLRASAAGVYYKCQFAGDEIVAEKVAYSGVALSVAEIPNEQNIDTKCLYSTFKGFAAGGDNVTSTLLSGIMKQTNTQEKNSQNAELPVYGRAYILTKDGQFVFGSAVKRSFREQLEAIDANWEQLAIAQKAEVLKLYSTYAEIMDSWNIPNVQKSVQ